MPSIEHNLNIHMYSLNELVENIFHLKMPLTIESLKEAKKMVVKMHPDKSRLPPEYFRFYKRAFELILDFYKSEHKQNQTITEDTTKYDAEVPSSPLPETASVTKTLKSMPTEVFQRRFNQLFEENMGVSRPDASRNEWFTSAESQYAVPETVSSKNMGAIFESIKVKQLASQLVVKQDLETVQPTTGTNLYEEAEEGAYITTDPFGKLKYEDLRKVHKDQTIFAVGATTHTLPQYKSAEQYAQERSRQVTNPIEKAAAERILAEREAARQERLWGYQHKSTLTALQNEERSKTVLSAFLQLR